MGLSRAARSASAKLQSVSLVAATSSTGAAMRGTDRIGLYVVNSAAMRTSARFCQPPCAAPRPRVSGSVPSAWERP